MTNKNTKFESLQCYNTSLNMRLMIKLVPKLYQKVKCFRFFFIVTHRSLRILVIQTCPNVPQTTHLHISIPTLFYMLVLIRASLHELLGVQRLCPLLLVLKPNRSTRQASSTILQLNSNRLGASVTASCGSFTCICLKSTGRATTWKLLKLKKETDRKRGMET